MRFFRNWQWPVAAPLTRGLAASLLVVFGLQLIFLKGYESVWMQQAFGLSHAGLREGEWWQLLTYGWLHAEKFPLHLLLNIWMLLLLGDELEAEIGAFPLAGLYLGGVLAAAAAWLAWDRDPTHGMIGASGAVFALLTAFAVLNHGQALEVRFFLISPRWLQVGVLASCTILVEILLLVTNGLPEVAHVAHLGGALFGWGCGRWWLHRRIQARPGPLHRRPEMPPNKTAVFSSGNPITLENDPSIVSTSQSPRS